MGSSKTRKRKGTAAAAAASAAASAEECPLASHVRVAEDELVVEMHDGRSVSVPLSWFPRLLHGSPKERAKWRMIGRGRGIHWPDLDEDIAVSDLLAGRRSCESQASLKRWLKEREQPS